MRYTLLFIFLVVTQGACIRYTPTKEIVVTDSKGRRLKGAKVKRLFGCVVDYWIAGPEFSPKVVNICLTNEDGVCKFESYWFVAGLNTTSDCKNLFQATYEFEPCRCPIQDMRECLATVDREKAILLEQEDEIEVQSTLVLKNFGISFHAWPPNEHGVDSFSTVSFPCDPMRLIDSSDLESYGPRLTQIISDCRDRLSEANIGYVGAFVIDAKGLPLSIKIFRQRQDTEATELSACVMRDLRDVSFPSFGKDYIFRWDIKAD